MDLDFLRKIRLFEANKVLAHLPEAARLLEIGAGAGWQAKFFSEHGFQVEAIDLPQSNYAQVRNWPVQNYDGLKIPFPDSSFDVVFSSNVLEHIQDQPLALKEMWRVLRPGGISIHIVPSSAWRFWTFISHYPGTLKELTVRSLNKNQKQQGSLNIKRSFVSRLSRLCLSPRHGEHGSAFSELVRFSKSIWKKSLEDSGLSDVTIKPLEIFYSGHAVLGRRLPLRVRQGLSTYLGSSTFLIKGKKTGEEK